MTELNKQWYEGTLEKDKYYYAKDSSEGDCIVHIDKSNELTFTGWEVPYKPDQSNILEPFKLRTELLAQVPSYEKWMAAYECQLIENELVTTLKELLKEWVQFETEENPNDFTVMSERMSELSNKTKEVLK